MACRIEGHGAVRVLSILSGKGVKHFFGPAGARGRKLENNPRILLASQQSRAVKIACLVKNQTGSRVSAVATPSEGMQYGLFLRSRGELKDNAAVLPAVALLSAIDRSAVQVTCFVQGDPSLGISTVAAAGKRIESGPIFHDRTRTPECGSVVAGHINVACFVEGHAALRDIVGK